MTITTVGKIRVYDFDEEVFIGTDRKGFRFYYVKYLPKGYRKVIGATTQPNGFYWACNTPNKFSKKYVQVLVEEEK